MPSCYAQAASFVRARCSAPRSCAVLLGMLLGVTQCYLHLRCTPTCVKVCCIAPLVMTDLPHRMGTASFGVPAFAVCRPYCLPGESPLEPMLSEPGQESRVVLSVTTASACKPHAVCCAGRPPLGNTRKRCGASAARVKTFPLNAGFPPKSHFTEVACRL